MTQRAGALVAVVLIASASATAGTVSAEPFFRISDLEQGESRRLYRPQADPCTFTQNTQFDLFAGSIACGSGATTDNQYLRVFDLDGEHGFAGEVCVDSLDYAVEQSSGDPAVTFNVYCTPQGLADSAPTNGIDRDVDLDPGLVFSTTISQPDAEFEYFNQPLGGCCNASLDDMAIEIASEDCLESGACISFFPGVTDFTASTKPYYIGAPDCGIVDPVNADLITGLGVNKLVMTLNGTCEQTQDAVPAGGPVSRTLLLLLILAAGMRWARD